MAIIAFPTNTIPETLNFGIRYNTQVSNTSLSGIVQTVELPGARWFGQMSFRDMTHTDSAALKAWLMELRGAAGRFYYGDISAATPQNTITGTAIIQSGSTDRVITVSGHSGTFSVGDRIQIGTDTSREYKMIVGVSGNDLTIEPLIRRTDYIGLEAEYTDPRGVFMLAGDEFAKWSVRSKVYLSDLSLDFVEAFT
jgi:hypothetical protein